MWLKAWHIRWTGPMLAMGPVQLSFHFLFPLWFLTGWKIRSKSDCRHWKSYKCFHGGSLPCQVVIIWFCTLLADSSTQVWPDGCTYRCQARLNNCPCDRRSKLETVAGGMSGRWVVAGRDDYGSVFLRYSLTMTESWSWCCVLSSYSETQTSQVTQN